MDEMNRDMAHLVEKLESVQQYEREIETLRAQSDMISRDMVQLAEKLEATQQAERAGRALIERLKGHISQQAHKERELQEKTERVMAALSELKRLKESSVPARVQSEQMQQPEQTPHSIWPQETIQARNEGIRGDMSGTYDVCGAAETRAAQARAKAIEEEMLARARERMQAEEKDHAARLQEMTDRTRSVAEARARAAAEEMMARAREQMQKEEKEHAARLQDMTDRWRAAQAEAQGNLRSLRMELASMAERFEKLENS